MLVFLLKLLLLFSTAVSGIVTPTQDDGSERIIQRSTSFTTGSQSVSNPVSHGMRTVTTSGGSGPVVFPQGHTQTFTRTVVSGQPGTSFSSQSDQFLPAGFGHVNTGMSTGGGKQTVTYSSSSAGRNGLDYNQLLAQGNVQNGQSYAFNMSSAGFPDTGQIGGNQVITRRRTVYSNGSIGGLEGQFPELGQLTSGGQAVVRTLFSNITSGGFQNIPGFEGINEQGGSSQNTQRRFIVTNFTSSGGFPGESQQFSSSSGGPVTIRNFTRVIRTKKIILNSKGEQIEVDDDDSNGFGFGNFSSAGGHSGQQQFSYSSVGLRFPPPKNPVITSNITKIVRTKKIILNSNGEPIEVDDNDGNFNFGNISLGGGSTGQQQYSFSSGGQSLGSGNSVIRRNVTRILRTKKIIKNSQGQDIEVDDDDNDFNFGNFTSSSSFAGQGQSLTSSGGLRTRNITRKFRTKKIITNSQGQQIEVDDNDGDGMTFGSYTPPDDYSDQQQSSHSSGDLRFPPSQIPSFTSRNITRTIRRKKVTINSKGEKVEVDDDDDANGSGSSVQQQSTFSSGGLRFPPPANPTFSRNITRIIRRKKIIVNSKGEPVEVDDEDGDSEANFNFGNFTFGNGATGQQQYSMSSGGLRFPAPANPTFRRNITRIIRRKKIVINAKGEPEEVDDGSDDYDYTSGSGSSVQQQSSVSSGGLQFPSSPHPSFTRNITRVIRRKKIITNSNGEPVEVDDEDGDSEANLNFGNYTFGSGTSGQQQYSYSSGGLRFPAPANPTFRRNITRIIRRKKVIVNSKGEPEEVDDDTENESDTNFGNYSFGSGSSGQQQVSVSTGGLSFSSGSNPSFSRNITRIIRRKKVVVNSKGIPEEVEDDDDSNVDFQPGNFTFGDGLSGQQQSSTFRRNVTRIIRRKKVTVNSNGEPIEVDDDEDENTGFGSGGSGQQQFSYSSGGLRFPVSNNSSFIRNITRTIRRKKVIKNSRGEPTEVEDNDYEDNFGSGSSTQEQSSFSSGGLRFPPPANPTFTRRNITRIIRRKKIIVNAKGEPEEVDDGSDDYDYTSGSGSSQQSSISSGGLRFPPPANPTFSRNVTRIIRRKKVVVNSKGEPTEIDDDDDEANLGTGFSGQQESSFSSRGPDVGTSNIRRTIRKKKIIINSKGEPVEQEDDGDDDFDWNVQNRSHHEFTSTSGHQRHPYSGSLSSHNITRITRRKKITINSRGEQVEVDDDDDNNSPFTFGNHTWTNGQQSYSQGGLRFPPPDNPMFTRNITRIVRRKKIIVNSKGEPLEVDDEGNDEFNLGNSTFVNGASGQQYSHSSGGFRLPSANPGFRRNTTRIIRRKKVTVNGKGVPEEIDDDGDDDDYNNSGSGSSVQQQSSASSGGLRFPPPANPTFTRNITRIIRRKKIIVNSKGEPVEVDDEDGDSEANFNFGNGATRQQQFSMSSGGLRFPAPANPTFRRNITRIIRRKKIIVNAKGEPEEVDDGSDDYDYTSGSGSSGQQQSSVSPGGLQFPSSPHPSFTRNITRVIRRKKIITNSNGEPVEVDDEDGESETNLNFGNYNFRNGATGQQQYSMSSGGLSSLGATCGCERVFVRTLVVSKGLRFPPPANPTFRRNITRIIRRKKIVINAKGEPEEVDDGSDDYDYSSGSGSSVQQQSSVSSGGLQFPSSPHPSFTRNITRVIRRKKIITNSNGEQVEIDDDDGNDTIDSAFGGENSGQQQTTFGSGTTGQKSYSSSGLTFLPPHNPQFTSRNITRTIRRKKIITNSKGEPVEVDDEDDNGRDLQFGGSGQQQSTFSSGGLRFPPPANPTFSRNITRIIRRKKIIVNSKGEPVEVEDDSDFTSGNHSFGGGVAGQQQYSYFSGGVRFLPPSNPLITRNITKIIRRKKIILNSKGEQVEVDDDGDGGDNFESNIHTGGNSEGRLSFSSDTDGKRRRNRRPGNTRGIRNTTRISKSRRIIKGPNGENITVDGNSGKFSDDGQTLINTNYLEVINQTGKHNTNRVSGTTYQTAGSGNSFNEVGQGSSSTNSSWSGQTGVNINEMDYDDYYDASQEVTESSSKQSNTDDIYADESRGIKSTSLQNSITSNGTPIKRGTETTDQSQKGGSGYKGSKEPVDNGSESTTTPASVKGKKRPKGTAKGEIPGISPGDSTESEEPDEYDLLGNGVTVSDTTPASKTFGSKGDGTKGGIIPVFIPVPDVSLTTTTVPSTTVTTTTTETSTTSTTPETTTRFSEFDSDFDLGPAEGGDSGEGPQVTTQDPEVEMIDVDQFGADRNVGDKQKSCDNSWPLPLIIFLWATLLAAGVGALLAGYWLMKKYGLCKCCCRRNNKDEIYTIDRDPIIKEARNSPDLSQDSDADRYAQNILLNQDSKGFAAGGIAAGKLGSANGSVSYPMNGTLSQSGNQGTTKLGEDVTAGSTYQNLNAGVVPRTSAYGGSQMNTTSSQRQSLECPSPRVVKTFRKMETQQLGQTSSDMNAGSDVPRSVHFKESGSIKDRSVLSTEDEIIKSLNTLEKADRLSASSNVSVLTEDNILPPRQRANTVTRITIEKHFIPHGDQLTSQSSIGSEQIIAGSGRNSPNINSSRSGSSSAGILQGQNTTAKLITTIIKQEAGIQDDDAGLDPQYQKSGVKRTTSEPGHRMTEDFYEQGGDSWEGNKSARSSTYKESPTGIKSESKGYSSYQRSPHSESKSFSYGNEGYLSKSSPLNVESSGSVRHVKSVSMGKNFLGDQSSEIGPESMGHSQSGSSSTSTKTFQDGVAGTRTVTTRKIITRNTSQQDIPEDIQVMEEMDDFLKYIDED